jgi:biotin transport system permease protein
MELIDRTPPDSPLARVPVGWKLLVITIVSLLVTIQRDWRWVLGVVVFTVVLYAIGRVPPRAWWRTMRGIWVIALILVLYTAWVGDWQDGVVASVRLVALISLGALITATTGFDEIVVFVQRALGPFRRFGADPEAVGLAAGMVLRFVPLLAAAAGETADAFRARGVRPWPWRLVFPLIRRALLLAQDVGAALAAREPAPEPAPA